MDSVQTIEEPTPKVGLWKGSFLLARASWSTLKLDKELVLFPILTSIVNLILIGLIYYVIHLLGWDKSGDISPEINGDPRTVTGIVVLVATYLLLGFSTLFFSAAIVASAMFRFKGGDPTVGYGLSQARKRFGSIFAFSLVATTVGVIVRMLEDKASWVSNLFGALLNVTWAVVSMFAIPVIVMSDKPINPFQAIRGSVDVFKKVWANNFIGGLGLGIATLIAFLIWLISAAILNVGVAVLADPMYLLITGPITLLSLVILISVFSALSSIFQAALYHYATTGESPVQFDKTLLKAAFRPKKNLFA